MSHRYGGAGMTSVPWKRLIFMAVVSAVFFYLRRVSRFISAAYILHLFSSNSLKSRSLCTSFSKVFTKRCNLW